ncbi:MAG: hypothetical protein COB13_001685 [OCS116 cluster bacterium]|uniref:Uncharacterized protein n=1 Tax=OCS116 cluster bacterium TaxID=2030921 RepID=A0A2A4Z1K9_9PROT|nr:hypothetical protein [OCS116 cluster bacterium]
MALILDKTLLKNPLAAVSVLGMVICTYIYYKHDVELAQHLRGMFLGSFLLVMAYVLHKRYELVEPQNRQKSFSKYFPILFAVMGMANLGLGIFLIFGSWW